ncbi:MAG TPA: DnaA regulatory inactivator Hda [Gammaproteobacteria bacterium]
MSVQLPLNIQLPESANFDTYVSGDNGLLLELLRQCSAGRGEMQIYCWSEPGLGKTHLLQACCHSAAGQGRLPCYLPLDELLGRDEGKDGVGPDILDNLESVDLLCLDGLQRITGRLLWEQALFSLINRCRGKGTRLVFAAGANIHELGLRLPDLASRLSWGPVFQIKPLGDDGKLLVLQGRAQRRGIELSDEVGLYMLRRFPRDIRFLCDVLDTLDRASLAAQRRVTIPFIKAVFENL